MTSPAKPTPVQALRATWRKTGEHAAEQGWRFLRLLVLASIVPVTDLIFAKTFSATTLLAVVVPIGEGLFRQKYPALGAAAADSAPGVTIVPDQIGLPAALPDPQDPGDPAPLVDPTVPVPDTTPTGEASASGATAPADAAPLGDAAP